MLVIFLKNKIKDHFSTSENRIDESYVMKFVNDYFSLAEGIPDEYGSDI
jgi:hypothetical protein